MVIPLGRHSPRESLAYESDPAQSPNQRVYRLGLPKSKSIPTVGHLSVQQMAQDSSGQRFWGSHLSQHLLSSLSRLMGDGTSGANQLSKELRRLHGSGRSGEKNSNCRDGIRGKMLVINHQLIVHLVTGYMFIEYLLCAAHHT